MDFTLLDENIAFMMAMVELEGQACQLKHSYTDVAEDHPAMNFLCQKLGDQETGYEIQELRIPICEECAEALNDKDWILAYCTNCNESQWIYRPKAKVDHPEGNGVYWMDVCPHCAEVATEYKGEE